LYKSETLVTLKAVALRLVAMIPVLLPLMETLSKIFNRNAVKGRQRFVLNLCNVSKTPPFWLKTIWWVVSHPTYSPNLNPCDFFVPRDKSGFEKEAFC
jgi:hypothetical protein